MMSRVILPAVFYFLAPDAAISMTRSTLSLFFSDLAWMRVLILIAAGAALSQPVTGQDAVADRIFHNGTILTMSADYVVGEAMATSGDTILALGTNEEILQLANDGTRVVDLVGRTIIPGFVDAHSHIFDRAADRGQTLQQVHGIALANGVTALADLYTTAGLIEELKAFQADNRLRVRTSLYMPKTDYCGTDLGDWYLDYPPTRDPRERLRIGGVKVFSDGGTCGGIATSFEYDGGFGDLWRSQTDFNAMVSEIDAAGYQLAIHAQGDRAIEQALAAIESLHVNGENVRRHRMEHNSFIREDLLKRYTEVSPAAVLFGLFPTCAETRFQALSGRFGEKNVLWLEDWRALLDTNPNVNAAWHSDYPYLILDPIRHLASYVTRVQYDTDGSICYPPPWLAEHAITAREALTLMTRGAAYALDWDSVIGSLEPGKFADFVILTQDPTSVEPTRVIDTEILATFIGGSLVFCRSGSERVCGLPVNSESELPAAHDVRLRPIHPNPSTGRISVSFETDHPTKIDISVFDVTGRLVTNLVNRITGTGHQTVTWDPELRPAGVYLIRMTSPERSETRTAVVLP